jgi:hypothetical protein
MSLGEWTDEERVRLVSASAQNHVDPNLLYAQDLEILDTESVGSDINKKPSDVPMVGRQFS